MYVPNPSIISVIYRPPGHLNTFISDFTDYLSFLANLNKPITILGDFNIHVNKPSKIVSDFNDTLELFHLSQYVHTSTHNLGNTLDLVISSYPINQLTVSDPYISDHFLIDFNCVLPSPKPARMPITISFRQTDSIEFSAFNASVFSLLPPLKDCPISPDPIYDVISSALSTTLDIHAPLITRSITSRPNTKWYNSELTKSKRYRRSIERKKRKCNNPNSIHYNHHTELNSLYKSATKSYFSLFRPARSNFTKNFLFENKNDSKILFKICKKLSSIPNSIPDSPISSDILAKFFIKKIDTIRSKIILPNSPEVLPDLPPTQLTFFQPFSSDEVASTINSSKKTFSPIDPFPSKYISSVLPVLLPYLVHLFNSSIEYGVFPEKFKHAIVTPLLKKSNSDPTDPQNYRPISLLNFFSKCLERLVISRLLNHMSSLPPYEIFQSGFKQFHSTETALLRVTNDLRRSSDDGQVSLLIMLDLSAAFDTIDHITLLNRLHTFIGLSDVALSWFKSYLSDRTFQVKQNENLSQKYNTKHGVPQGSVPGPILFRTYIIPLLALLSRLGVSYHVYADDTQFYISCSSADFRTSIDSVSRTYSAISDWLSDNFLKLNHNKTEVILIGTPSSVSFCKSIVNSIELGGSSIPFSPIIKNLGVLFDESLCFHDHITNCRKTAFHTLHNLRHIRDHFDKAGFETLIHAFVTSKLDYCNSLFSNLPKSNLQRLQSIQNYAARLIFCRSIFDHVTPLLQKLHWLPVSMRIDFKILLITYKAVHLSNPPYFAPNSEFSILRFKTPTRNFRHQDELLLEIPRSHSAKMGDRAFSIYAPKLWNSIPYSIRSAPSINIFKNRLKTLLFHNYYHT